MSTYLSSELRIRLEEMDNHRCVYCRTSAWNTGQPLTVDHIIPKAQGGETTSTNLCLACRSCNEYKGPQTIADDPLTGEIVPLFHPRQQNWQEHFAWDESGVWLTGLTAIGRATIVALRMNNPVIIVVRRR